MKKYSKFIVSTLLVFILFFTTTACSSDKPTEENKDQNKTELTTQVSVEKLLLGEWRLQSQTNSDGSVSEWKLQTVKLYEDGTCMVNGESGTWKILGDELMVLGSYGGRFWGSDAIVGRFNCDGNVLEFYNAQIDAKDTSVNLIYKKAN